MHELKVKVRGMNCNHCKISVETGLQKISGIEFVRADILNGEVTLRGDGIDLIKVKAAVEDLGYLYTGEIQ